MNNYDFLLTSINKLPGVGKKTAEILKKKNINKIFDLLYRIPQSFTDRTNTSKISKLQIGKISTLRVLVKKYSFPRIRNLPSKVICMDETGEVDCVFFNSYEGYVKKILPLNKEVTISGKINYYKNRYQITNPTYVSFNNDLIEKVHNKYSLTQGISEKFYNKIINQVLTNLPDLNEWLNHDISKKFDKITWKDSIKKLHDPKNIGKFKENFYKRLVFDEHGTETKVELIRAGESYRIRFASGESTPYPMKQVKQGCANNCRHTSGKPWMVTHLL